jgi:hypothetical protein
MRYDRPARDAQRSRRATPAAARGLQTAETRTS